MCSFYLARPFSARHSWNSTYQKMGHEILQGNSIVSLFSTDEAADWSHGLKRQAHAALEDHSLVTLESLLLPVLSLVSLCVRWDADNVH